MYRNTYALIDKEVIGNNVKNIISNYPNYKYYIGVVKNNAYNHGLEIITNMLQNGINMLAVSSLDEAMEIRDIYKDVPILVLEPITLESVVVAIENKITLTVDSLEYLEKLEKLVNAKVKIHFKLDTGMNRLGFKNREELENACNLIWNSKYLELEGLYTHFATSGRYDKEYEKQLNKFYYLIENIDIKKIPIIHLDRSITLVSHDKIDIATGVRLGIVMYGFSESVKKDNSFKGKLRAFKRNLYLKKNKIKPAILENNLDVKTAFSLYSEVISVRKVEASETVGYDTYKVMNDDYIATIAIGYGDGVTKDFKYVYINNKPYEIVSDSMDMIMVLGDKEVKVGDKVEIIGENAVKVVSRRLGINSYHLFNQITRRVSRRYR